MKVKYVDYDGSEQQMQQMREEQSLLGWVMRCLVNNSRQKYIEFSLFSDFVVQIEQKRNDLLYKYDWTQLPDTRLTAEQIQECRTYREALRGITSQITTIGTPIVWPEAPLV